MSAEKPESSTPATAASPAPELMTRENFKAISSSELDSMTKEQKARLIAGIHVECVNHPDLAEALCQARIQGCLQAEREGRSLSEVVCVLARKTPDENLFQRHPRLNDEQRKRFLAKLTPEQVEEYEGLGTAKRLYAEEDWATENWTWLRHVAQFPAEAEWAAWPMFVDQVKADPLFYAGLPISNSLHELVAPIAEGSKAVVKYLVIAGNHGSVVLGIPKPDYMDKPEADEDEAPEDGERCEHGVPVGKSCSSICDKHG